MVSTDHVVADDAEPTARRAAARTGRPHSGSGTVDSGTVDSRTVDDARRWRRAVGAGLAAYVVSRLCVLAGAAVRASQLTIDARVEGDPEPGTASLVTSVLTSWDGRWYLELVRRGYPTDIPPNVTYDDLEARAAFFPMYPGAVDVFDTVLPGGDTFAALLLNLILGAVAVVLVGTMARRVFDVRVATRAMFVFAFFPGSFVLSFAYSEALLIVFSASCLLLLMDERWLLAGLAAALATATRPNGIAVVLACLVAAAVVVRDRREWRALGAVVLAPLGFVAFQLYVDGVAGERGAWFRVQSEAWAEGASFGLTAIRNTFTFVTDPFESPAGALTALSLVALVGMGYCAWRRRLPLPWIAYCAVVIALMLIPETVTARPRFVFTAFPLFVAVAAWWPEPDPATAGDRVGWDRAGWDFVLLLSGAGLVGLTGLYAVFGAIP